MLHRIRVYIYLSGKDAVVRYLSSRRKWGQGVGSGGGAFPELEYCGAQ